MSPSYMLHYLRSVISLVPYCEAASGLKSSLLRVEPRRQASEQSNGRLVPTVFTELFTSVTSNGARYPATQKDCTKTISHEVPSVSFFGGEAQR